MLTEVALVVKVLVLCRLVKDKTTQKLKGTAFVEFERPEDAQRAAAACAKARCVCTKPVHGRCCTTTSNGEVWHAQSMQTDMLEQEQVPAGACGGSCKV